MEGKIDLANCLILTGLYKKEDGGQSGGLLGFVWSFMRVAILKLVLSWSCHWSWSTLVEWDEQPLVSYSVHEGKHFLLQLWVDYFLSWFTMGLVQLFIHLLLLKFSMSFFKKWAIPGLFFFIFVFSIQLRINIQYKILPMTGFEPWTSWIGSDPSTNWATTTALCHCCLSMICCLSWRRLLSQFGIN